MRYLGMILMCLLTLACATSSNPKSSTDVTGDATPPRVVHKVDPEYPAQLRREGVTGVVTIEATIDRAGQLLNPQVLRSSDPRLNDLALEAVRKWHFQPGTLNGEPVDVLFQVDVSFSIP